MAPSSRVELLVGGGGFGRAGWGGESKGIGEYDARNPQEASGKLQETAIGQAEGGGGGSRM